MLVRQLDRHYSWHTSLKTTKPLEACYNSSAPVQLTGINRKLISCECERRSFGTAAGACRSAAKDECHPQVRQMMDEEEVIGMLEPEAFARWVHAQLQRDREGVVAAMSLFARVNAGIS